MLKIRLIPALLFKNFSLVKSIKFTDHRMVGNPIQAIRVYNARNVDELVFLDITASTNHHQPRLPIIQEISDECFMPFTYGGGIKSIDHIKQVLQNGADKVAVNTAAFLNPRFISQAANIFGNQTVVVSIDAKKVSSEKYEVFINSGTRPTRVDVVKWAQTVQKLGAGEIYLTSIDQDGTMSGFDTKLIKQIAKKIHIPIIAAGGAGEPAHFLDAIIEGLADAVSAASIFHFTHYTPLMIKQYLYQFNIPVRLI